MDDCINRRDLKQVTIFTLCAPKMRNSISVTMRKQLLALLIEALDDPECRVIVLTGAEGHFCSGGRLPEGANTEPDPDRTRRNIEVLQDIVRLLAMGDKPVVAAVEGFADGAGLSLVAACDYVVAGRSASFCASFGKVGLMPDAGLSWLLPQRVGMSHARDLLLSARRVGATEAQPMGLVNSVVDDGDALDAAIGYAFQVAGVAPLSLSATKKVLAQSALGLEAVFSAEADIQPRLTLSKDYAEGRAAFRERRPPVFSGR